MDNDRVDQSIETQTRNANNTFSISELPRDRWSCIDFAQDAEEGSILMSGADGIHI